MLINEYLCNNLTFYISRVNSTAVWPVRTPASCRLNTPSSTTTTTRTGLSKSFSNRKSSYLTIMRPDYSRTLGRTGSLSVVGFLLPIFANVRIHVHFIWERSTEDYWFFFFKFFIYIIWTSKSSVYYRWLPKNKIVLQFCD